MFGPGEYRPDPSAGITAPADLLQPPRTGASPFHECHLDTFCALRYPMRCPIKRYTNPAAAYSLILIFTIIPRSSWSRI